MIFACAALALVGRRDSSGCGVVSGSSSPALWSRAPLLVVLAGGPYPTRSSTGRHRLGDIRAWPGSRRELRPSSRPGLRW